MNMVLNVLVPKIRQIVLVVVAMTCLGFLLQPAQAMTNDAAVEDVRDETRFELLNSIKEQLSAILVNLTTTSVGKSCVDNKQTYAHGNTIPSLTLNNGLKSTIKGSEYRCDNGRWIMQKQVPINASSSVAGDKNLPGQAGMRNATNTPRTSTILAQGSCKIDSETYVDGAIVAGKTLASGSTTSEIGNGRSSIFGVTSVGQSDASVRGTSSGTSTRNRTTNARMDTRNYQCQKGKWVVMPQQAACRIPNSSDLIPHGQSNSSGARAAKSATSTRTGDIGNTSSNRILFGSNAIKTCVNGKLRENAATCKIGNSLLFHGDSTRSAGLISLYRSSSKSNFNSGRPGTFFSANDSYLRCSNGVVRLERSEPSGTGVQNQAQKAGSPTAAQPSGGTPTSGGQQGSGGQTSGGSGALGGSAGRQ